MRELPQFLNFPLQVARVCHWGEMLNHHLRNWVGFFLTGRKERTMKFHTEYLTFHTKKHREYIHLTPQVEAIVTKSGIKEGMVLVSAMHITAGVYVNDNESGPAVACVARTLLSALRLSRKVGSQFSRSSR